MTCCVSRWRLGAMIIPFVAAAFVDATSPAAARRRGDQDDPPRQELAGRALLAVVSLTRQRISLYDGKGNAIRASISSGQNGYETPSGVFSVLQKEEEHYSNLYDDASMPFMQRITWSGVALHAGALPGYPASHGCVRLPHEFAEHIFPQTRLGMRVVIATDDVAPAPVDNALLLQPETIATVAGAARANRGDDEEDVETSRLPDVRAWPARYQLQQKLQRDAETASRILERAKEKAEEPRELVTKKQQVHAKAKRSLTATDVARLRAQKQLGNAERRLAEASKPSALRAAETAKAAAESSSKRAEERHAAAVAAEKQASEALASATEAAKGVEAEEAAAATASKDATRRMRPVSIYINLRSQRLYVRQLNEAVIDVPITVRDPHLPGGTHVFTVMGYDESGNRARWNVVSLTHRVRGEEGDDDEPRRRRKSRRDVSPPLTDVAAASAVLDRIEIPSEIRSRFSQFVWPGSSLIVTDEELSKETGQATDFVVVMSDSPQGALKSRPKPEARSYADDDDYADRRYRRYFRTYRAPAAPQFGWW